MPFLQFYAWILKFSFGQFQRLVSSKQYYLLRHISEFDVYSFVFCQLFFFENCRCKNVFVCPLHLHRHKPIIPISTYSAALHNYICVSVKLFDKLLFYYSFVISLIASLINTIFYFFSLYCRAKRDVPCSKLLLLMFAVTSTIFVLRRFFQLCFC